MEDYNYRESICEDIREYINYDGIKVTTSNREEVEQELYEELFIEDSITGNASGSYTFNACEAERNLLYNKDLLIEAIEAFGDCPEDYKKALESPEFADVMIRCYLLGECISEVLDELEVADDEE